MAGESAWFRRLLQLHAVLMALAVCWLLASNLDTLFPADGPFAGGILVGLVEATTALVMPPSLKAVGIYAVYLLVVFIRPRGLFGSI